MTGKSNIVKRIFGIVTIPALAFIVFAMLAGIKEGAFLFGSGSDVLVFVKSAASVTLTTFALSINLNSGRFDFSLGSISLMSSIIACKLTIDKGWAPWVMIVLALVIGMVAGFVSGLLYVLLRLPAIITSLGVSLLYEAIAFIFADGAGIVFSNNKEYLSLGQSTAGMIIVTVIAFVFMFITMNYTKFGLHYAALRDGQKVSVNTGIAEVWNAIGCYTIAGVMMGLVGVISATFTGSILQSLNFGSIGVMFTAFLPMFIGGFIGRFSEVHFGIVLGAVTYAITQIGFSKLGLSSEQQALFSAVILVLFLIYLNNERAIVSLFTGKKKKKAK